MNKLMNNIFQRLKRINPFTTTLWVLFVYVCISIITMFILGLLTPGGEQLPIMVFVISVDLFPFVGILSMGFLCVMNKEWTQEFWFVIVLMEIIFGLLIYKFNWFSQIHSGFSL